MALQDDDEMLKLNAGDVTVEELVEEDCECGENPVTHRVWLDMRSNGLAKEIFRGCVVCATDFSDRLKSSLPTPAEEAAV